MLVAAYVLAGVFELVGLVAIVAGLSARRRRTLEWTSVGSETGGASWAQLEGSGRAIQELLELRRTEWLGVVALVAGVLVGTVANVVAAID